MTFSPGTPLRPPQFPPPPTHTFSKGLFINKYYPHTYKRISKKEKKKKSTSKALLVQVFVGWSPPQTHTHMHTHTHPWRPHFLKPAHSNFHLNEPLNKDCPFKTTFSEPVLSYFCSIALYEPHTWNHPTCFKSLKNHTVHGHFRIKHSGMVHMYTYKCHYQKMGQKKATEWSQRVTAFCTRQSWPGGQSSKLKVIVLSLTRLV